MKCVMESFQSTTKLSKPRINRLRPLAKYNANNNMSNVKHRLERSVVSPPAQNNAKMTSNFTSKEFAAPGLSIKNNTEQLTNVKCDAECQDQNVLPKDHASPENRCKHPHQAVTSWLDQCNQAITAIGNEDSGHSDAEKPHSFRKDLPPRSDSAGIASSMTKPTSRRRTKHSDLMNSVEWSSSICSTEWGDEICDFDREESKRVNRIFEEIERMLFEGSPCQPTQLPPADNAGARPAMPNDDSFLDSTGTSLSHLSLECSEWSDRFPHLRLVGARFTQSKASESNCTTPTNNTGDVFDFSPEREEVLAFDYTDHAPFTCSRREKDKRVVTRNSATSSNQTMVLYTASACSDYDTSGNLASTPDQAKLITDHVLQHIFTQLSHELFESSINPAIDKHWLALQTQRQDANLEDVDTEQSFCNYDSMISSQKVFPDLQSERDVTSLGNLLTISSKTLQHRNKSFISESSEASYLPLGNFSETTHTAGRPHSATHRTSHQHQSQPQQQQQRRMHAVKLAPLETGCSSPTPHQQRSATEDHSEHCAFDTKTDSTLSLLRGKSLLTSGSPRLSKSPEGTCATLPPLHPHHHHQAEVSTSGTNSPIGRQPIGRLPHNFYPHHPVHVQQRAMARHSPWNQPSQQQPQHQNQQQQPQLPAQQHQPQLPQQPQQQQQPSQPYPDMVVLPLGGGTGNCTPMATSGAGVRTVELSQARPATTISVKNDQLRKNSARLVKSGGAGPASTLGIQGNSIGLPSNNLPGVGTVGAWSSLSYHRPLQGDAFEDDFVVQHGPSSRAILHNLHKRTGRHTSMR